MHSADDPSTPVGAEAVLPSLGSRSGCSSRGWVASAWVAAGDRFVGGRLASPASRLVGVEAAARPFSCSRGGDGSYGYSS
jgi:hypothetical protein